MATSSVAAAAVDGPSPPAPDDLPPDYRTSRPSKFRFKKAGSKRRAHSHTRSSRSASPRRTPPPRDPFASDEDAKEESRSKRSHRRRHHHHHHHSSRHRHKRSPNPTVPPDDPAAYDDTYAHPHPRFPAPGAPGALDADAAFRESLFDALADDEGAAYWEGVYGQPIHVYPASKPGPGGELEEMSEEEYVRYVRARMWERSYEGVEEERRRRGEERRRWREEVERERKKERERERGTWEGLLGRGVERRRVAVEGRAWEGVWTVYARRWEEVMGGLAKGEVRGGLKGVIPWPVRSGKATDVERGGVREFYEKAAPEGVLKGERVKWHPDKMQQRFGGRLDAETVRLVTAVFQVVDGLWGERREKEEKK